MFINRNHSHYSAIKCMPHFSVVLQLERVQDSCSMRMDQRPFQTHSWFKMPHHPRVVSGHEGGGVYSASLTCTQHVWPTLANTMPAVAAVYINNQAHILLSVLSHHEGAQFSAHYLKLKIYFVSFLLPIKKLIEWWIHPVTKDILRKYFSVK